MRHAAPIPQPPLRPPKGGSSQSPTRGRVRRSWFPGAGRSRSSSKKPAKRIKSYAWIMSDDPIPPGYNTSFLQRGEKVPELWNESGNVWVYLYPRASGCGPSFKVPEFTISSSCVFNELIQVDLENSIHARNAARYAPRPEVTGAPPVSYTPPESPGCMRLYLPATPPTASVHLSAPGEGSDAELDRLVGLRNLFAFLTGQPLVGTKSKPSMFLALLDVADLLQEFAFWGNGDSSFGDAVNLSFGFYSDQLGLADCRHSREKTVEALILGERMRNLDLYNEAFAHAAGKYSAMIDLRLPLFGQVSAHTRERLERAHLDLVNRQHNVNEHLEQFEFPSLFAGIANSSSFPELRQVRFKAWRNSFSRMRNFTLNHYRHAFGSWPPKASSKKNPFAEGGLNRLVLKALYSDMCALYDLLVDRTRMTTRVIDEVPDISDAADRNATSALRNILSEFDRSKPPVLPPIPFDLPQLPSMTAIHETFYSLPAKDQIRFERRIKSHELLLILNKAYNYDMQTVNLPFLEEFRAFEMREAKGKMSQDISDQRVGYWIFLYVVLQSLPMLVVDAPDLHFSEGVEYFLCQPPMGSPPWVEDKQVRKMWYEVSGGGGRLVELSADAVMFSVEATYHRSHCWVMAQTWEALEGAPATTAPVPATTTTTTTTTTRPMTTTPTTTTPTEERPPPSPLGPPRRVFTDGPLSYSLDGSSAPSLSATPSPPPSLGQLRPRNLSPGLDRNHQAWRSSVALGLEPLPMEPPNVFGSHGRSSSVGPRPMSSHVGFRSVSTGNLAMYPRSATPQSSTPSTTGATFDDILGSPVAKSKDKEKLKKSRFF
ncbi:choriogenin hminor [Ophiocordyceps camponoti-floridani]|uniref:Choriogenin hminor n=1 Tax=Ophiocordyceps camponoti-floridani TaxID=2030778 RepID=A0A8H4Q0Y1_9HYPO|nr:choriogenin hminor [Ophiocordyceps camponoti-floridani]